MVNKRGRKRTTEMYFGPEEEEAVVKFLESRYLQTLNFEKNVPIKITHGLGKLVIISGSYLTPNETHYGNDSKFIEEEIEFSSNTIDDFTVEISTDLNISGVTVIIVNKIERDIVFNEWLKSPLDKMVESIIRKYKLYRKSFTFEELHCDTISFLMTKVHKFEPNRGKKAYSYFGTIAKHYIIGLLIKDEKHTQQMTPFDDVSNEVESMIDMAYSIDSDKFPMDTFIKNLSNGIKIELENDAFQTKKKMNENEKKVGYALVEILENWETVFNTMDGGAKYNKNSVLETMRNCTNLSTKDIRLAMKRYKELYKLLKQHGL